jgi:hypothetical protein
MSQFWHLLKMVAFHGYSGSIAFRGECCTSLSTRRDQRGSDVCV